MKLRALLLALSFALNLALLAVLVLKPSLALPAFRAYFGSGSRASTSSPDVGPSESPRPGAKTDSTQLWSVLRSNDLPTLIARLRDAGFPPEMARAVVTAAVNARFAARFDALFAPLETVPYWKPDPLFPGTSANRKFLEEDYNPLERERTKALREALADPFFARVTTADQRRSFGDLSAAKIELIQRINDDYAAMTTQVHATMNGLTLPEDREKLALLQREKRADLVAALTPAELAEYDLHNSPVISYLRTPLTLMNATEDEFQTIFRLRLESDLQRKATGTATPANSDPAVIALQKSQLLELAQNLRNALGGQRYADYERASSYDFQQLSRIARRENLPSEAILPAYALRDSVALQSTRIVDDAALSVDQKRVALQSLADGARAQIQTLLGPTAGAAYLPVANRWLRLVEQGGAIAFGPNGATTTNRLPPPAKN